MRVALVFGGRSGEHEVSVVSARSVRAALDESRHEVLPMAIDHQGRWADPATAARVLGESGDRTDRVLAFAGAHALDPRLLDGSVDVVLPILHGPFGEDGTIQGLCELLDLPYVGCGVAASAVCMDKALTKRLLAFAGLATPTWVEVAEADWRADPAAVTEQCRQLTLPVFVKPARLGSSVGITKARMLTDLAPALAAAFAHDDLAIVERGVDGRELELAVLGDANPRASVPGEVVPGHEFYDYADKYLDDDCKLLAPAPLDEGTVRRAQELAVAAYTTLGCAGMARVDLFLERSSAELMVNEVNTIPGFTSISMYPRLWQVSGLAFSALLDELIALALERHHRRREKGRS